VVGRLPRREADVRAADEGGDRGPRDLREEARVIRRALLLAVAFAALSAAPAHASTWCGAERASDVPRALFGGDDVHVAYVRPSDGADRFSQFANAIETDAEHIDAWWRGQDPTRTPRFDETALPCGAQLDLSSVQLTQTGSQLMDPDALFQRIYFDLQSHGLATADRTALVYYDGPADGRFCGLGGPTSAGSKAGLGVVLMNVCPLQSSERVAARELLAAFGGVADGAPHKCPDKNATCDDPTDIMVGYIPEGPLSAAVLDPGRDDYYGHSGSWLDLQDSPFLRHLDAQVRLGVSIAGRGTVRSDVPGVACSTSCATDWDAGAFVSLAARPRAGMRFVRWSGACRGAGPCRLTLDRARKVAALFAPRTYRLTVSVAGRGRVVSRPAGIACGSTCRHAFTSYVPVRLTAKPANGWRLKAWAGACRGAKAVCTVPMRRAASARAVFVRRG
jgi:hypothetical protein